MGTFMTPWHDASRHCTYRRGDKLVVTGNIQNSADGISGSQGTFTNKTVYFYGYFSTSAWTVKVPICVGLSPGTAWAYVTSSMIKSGGTLDTYTVSYNANGGGGVPGSQTKTYGQTLKLSTTKPTRTGYTFTGWNTKSDGSGTNYASGANYTANAAVTLYAKWSINTYTVSYNANGGSGAPASQTKTYGKTLTLSGTKPTRYGYTFKGWAKSSTGSVVYQPGGSLTENTNVTLYAIWEVKTYSITYNLNGGTNSSSNPTSYKYGTGATLYNPTRTGYTFTGWTATWARDNGMGAQSGVSITKINASETGNFELTANWKINSYTITIDEQNGKSSYTKTVNYGATLSLGTPLYTGHTFQKWVVSGSGSVSGTTFTCGAGNATIVAQWNTNNYVASYDANGGTVSPTYNTIAYGSNIVLPTPIWKHHTFLGWYTAREGGSLVTASYVITGNITVYAHWKNNTSVTVNNNDIYKNGYPMPKETIFIRGRAYVNKGGGNKTWKEGNSIDD